MSRIPVTVITGFLGAGKTTLVRHLLAHPGGRRLALIVNEFGEVGIDRELLLGCGLSGCQEEDLIELANGCLCCTVAEDFLPTMRRLLEREQPPEHILVETSGLALPKPLIKAFNWPDVRNRATVDGVIAVVDAEATASGLFAPDPAALERARAADPAREHDSPLAELFAEQIACADLVLLSKVDRVDAEALARAEAMVAEHLRPGVRVLRTSFGRVAPTVLLGLGAAAEADLETRPSHTDGTDQHDHDAFTSFVLEAGEIDDPALLAEAVRRLAQRQPLYRAKGFMAVRGRPMRLVVQAVGDRIERWFDRAWQAGEARRSHLVLIGARGLVPDLCQAELAPAMPHVRLRPFSLRESGAS